MRHRKSPWVAARQEPEPATPVVAEKRRLSAQAELRTATIAGVEVVRLDVSPTTDTGALSYAVAPEAQRIDWQPRRGLRLPAGIRWRREAESRFAIEFPLPMNVRCLGLGELYRGLNRRGQTHVLFNSDDPHHMESTPRLYKSIPFLILEHEDRYEGLFLDSPAPQKWGLGGDLSEIARIELLTRRGWQLYAMAPSSLAEIVHAYTELTGCAELPPRWSLGHQQCRWSYPTEKRMREVAREFRKRGIPCDTMVADIDYMDAYRVFTVSRQRFPTFEKMSQELARDGFHLVAILDPAVKRSPRDATYRSFHRADAFCKTAGGRPYVGRVWAGESHLPDFLRADVRELWGEKLRLFDRIGVAGVWNDMNEPALFNAQTPFDTTGSELPPEHKQLFLQESPEGPVGHFEVRNAYGSQMARACWEALLKHRPDRRPFVLSRAAYAGHQRFGAVWLGDNSSWFEHLRLSIPMLVSVGLCGLPFCGVDVGGFGHDADGELLIRWYQVGIFYPFFRNHCARGQRAQEPWAFGHQVEQHVKRLIATRYQLIPYIEALFYEHRRTGAPLMRPLVWHVPEDAVAREIDDQFFFGPDLIVAPIVFRGHRTRTVYLPRGNWHPFAGGPILKGGQCHVVEWDFDAVPAFVREGAILPLAAPVLHTGELELADLTFRCFGSRARGVYREDDGQSLGYQRGETDEWELSWSRGRFRAIPTQLGYGRGKRRYFVSDGEDRTLVDLPR